MKLGSLFGTPKTLARAAKKKPINPPDNSNLAGVIAKKPKPGEFNIVWAKIEPQKVKDYKPILTVAELEE